MSDRVFRTSPPSEPAPPDIAGGKSSSINNREQSRRECSDPRVWYPSIGTPFVKLWHRVKHALHVTGPAALSTE